MTLKGGIAFALVGLGLGLAYFVTGRLSTDALNLAVGVLCGIGASLPVSLGLLAALYRRTQPVEEEVEDATAYPQYAGHGVAGQHIPQVIVLAPQPSQYSSAQLPFGYPTGDPSQFPAGYVEPTREIIDGRDWRIIGEDS